MATNANKTQRSILHKQFSDVYGDLAIVEEEDKKDIRIKFNEVRNNIDSQCKNKERKNLAHRILDYYTSDECLDNVGHSGSIHNIVFEQPGICNLEEVMHNIIHNIDSNNAPSEQEINLVNSLLNKTRK